ncbi:hypothetical protein K437DRAFT_254041 [Tilletiaria anomala UBC 951]|uniref:Uncharacterized protein n=1 Tax=Tilletiaria anomala (strain ATCC 24038 / CBS 436.72 / UBC 951) TaxID=1037660 RepID=A0A066WF79_TILAU|nr:uncharacterized protein K437DRAFT_254041 [Tilletiaria anomala UBC 951]KDN52637.1 hypothetical protein K437DRAFT_254041 [Tilletiaria anomala UBC 951]
MYKLRASRLCAVLPCFQHAPLMHGGGSGGRAWTAQLQSLAPLPHPRRRRLHPACPFGSPLSAALLVASPRAYCLSAALAKPQGAHPEQARGAGKVGCNGDGTHRDTKPRRLYRYVIDVHGQLFLHDTVPKNLTSCFKNTEFLDFFFMRLRPNDVDPAEANPSDAAVQPQQLSHDWTDELAGKLTHRKASALARSQGYQWISPCMGELNFVKSADTPIVYRDISHDGKLRWAGTLTTPFNPDQLFVHPATGRLYTLSPPSGAAATSLTARGQPSTNRFGDYSLLSSALVLQHLAAGLHMHDDLADRAPGDDAGSVEWHAKTHRLRLLDPRSIWLLHDNRKLRN